MAISDAWISMSGVDVANGTFSTFEKSIFSLRDGFDEANNSIKIMGMSLKSFLGISAGIMGAVALFKALDYATHDYTRTLEKAKDAASDYSSSKSELESLRSEFDETKSKIEELQALSDAGTISLADEVELNKLKRENSELERQLDLQEKIVDAKAQESASAAQEAASSEKSYVEKMEDEYGGFWGKIIGFSGYIVEPGEMNSYGSKGQAQSAAMQYESQDNTMNGQIKQSLKDLETYEKELDAVYDKLSKDPTNENLLERRTQLNSMIAETTTELNNQANILQGWINQSTVNGVAVEGFETFVDGLRKSLNEINNYGKSIEEIEFNNLETFFSSSNKKFIGEQLREAYKEGKDLEKELNRMGLTLDDLGIENISSLSKYFKDTTKATEEATKSVQDYASTVEDIEGAGKSEDKDKGWSIASEAHKTAKELLAEGKTGIDDFQSVVGFLNPEGVKDYLDNGVDNIADAYQKAYEDVKVIADKWFGEDEESSMKNFVNDFKDKGLFDVTTDDMGLWDIETNFKTTAEAADKFGISVEAVETMLMGLEAYGYDFSKITFSTKGIKEYELALNGLHDIHDSLTDGAAKDRLKNLLTGWDDEFAKYQNDLDSLSEEQIVKIKFEYDLATIQQKIDELQRIAEEGGDTQSWAELNASKRVYREKSEEREGNNIESDSNYQQVSNTIIALQDQMQGATNKQKEQIQEQISNLYDLQNALNDAFADSGLSWEEFINTEDYQDAINNMISSSEDAKEIIAKALGIDVDDIVIKVDAEDNASEVIKKVSEEQLKDKLVKIIGEDDATPYITLWNMMSADPKFTTLSADDQASLVVETYNSLSIEDKESLISQSGGEVTESVANSVKSAIESIPSSRTVSIGARLSETFNSTVSNALLQLSKIPGGQAIFKGGIASGTMLSPAHASGTAYNVLNAPLISAYAGGRVALPNNQRALVNEEYINGHSESIVRDGVWRLIPGGAHLENLKKGDIIFSAQQTEDLLRSGKTPGHARTYASGTVLSPAYRLGSTSGSSGSTSKKSSSSKSSSSSSSADEFLETIDEIEILLSEFERQIGNFDTVAQGAYRSWQERNKALSDEMSKVTELITIQQQAYDKYISKANSIGLSSDWVDKIINGKLAIEDITDENLKEKIDEFQEWSDKAKQASDAILELRDDLADLASQRFENTKTEYENLLSTVEHRIDMIEGSIDQIEVKGHIVSTKMYNELAKTQLESISILEQEYASLQTELSNAMASGNIEQFSDEWYSLVGDIQDVESEILDLNTALVETNNEIRELNWENFDRMQEMISGVVSEAEFLQELMSDEKMFNANDASITEQGRATIGLHAVKYNTYLAQVEDYAKEIQKINEDIANDPNNINLLERRQELLDAHRDSILAAEDEKDAIKDLAEEYKNTFLDAMNEIIDKRKEMWQKMDDIYNFEREISDLTTEISNLKKIESAFIGDTSEAGRAKLQEIQDELKNKERDLGDTQRERYIEEQEKLLDSLMNESEQWLSERIDNSDLIMQGAIDATNSKADEIKNTLVTETEKVGTTLSDAMLGIWGTDGTYTSVVSTFEQDFNNSMTTTNNILSKIKSYLAKMLGIADEEASKEIDSTNTNTPKTDSSTSSSQTTTTNDSTDNKQSSVAKTISVGNKINAGSAKIYDYAGDTSGKTQYFDEDPIYTVLAEKNGYLKVRHHKLSKGVTGWFKKSDVKAYKHGGLLDETGLFWGDGTKERPELVLNSRDTENFIKLKDTLRAFSDDDFSLLRDTFKAPESMFKSMNSWSAFAGITPNNGFAQDVTIDFGGIVMNGVNDPDVFADKMVYTFQNNNRVRNTFVNGTAGVLLQKNSLNIMKY